MRKTIPILAVIMFILATSSIHLPAQKQVDFSVNIGLILHHKLSFKPFYWTTSANLDVYLTEEVTISPEVQWIMGDFDFKKTYLAPGLMLNYNFDDIQLGHFYTMFVGGGVVKFFPLDKNAEFENKLSEDVALKLNLGFKGDATRLLIYYVTPFEDLGKGYFGITFGFFF